MFIKKNRQDKGSFLVNETDEIEHGIRHYFSSTKTGQELEDYINDISETVRIGLDQSLNILTPWFFSNMPNIYYKTTPRAEKVRHLSAIITGNIFEAKQTVELWSVDRTKVTFIGPGGKQKTIIDIANKLKHLNPSLGLMYFSHDKLLFIATFFCREFKPYHKKNNYIQEKIESIKKEILAEYNTTQKELAHFLKNLDHDFLKYATSKRLLLTYKMLSYMKNHEGAHTFINKSTNTNQQSLILGLKGLSLSEVIDHVVNLINRYEFEIIRFYANEFTKGYNETINIMYVVISPVNKITQDDIIILQKKLIKALRTLAWTDSDDYSQFTKTPYSLSINGASLIRSLGVWVRVILGKDNIYYYSEHKVLKTFLDNKTITISIINLFQLKFNPDKNSKRTADYNHGREILINNIEILLDQIERKILKECINFIDNLLKTNYFLPTKTGLAFRIDPTVLNPQFYPQTPYGLIFITGKDYRFFHIRWKQVSRGGLRVVVPNNITEYDYTISGLFDEVYGLSYAQQLKNKDIPEGGSKGVMVVKPKGDKNRAVKGAINALLDLLVSQDESQEENVSLQINYCKNEEYIYLGPDENITNDLITWTTSQAKRRGYKYAKAFMSSKPEDGINHKKYGVTSEGLHIYVHDMLKHLNIDPKKESFTVKMTGGTSGDVAGNELKILYRSYNKNCKVLSIADGSGAAYDPNGLNWKELLTLIEQDQPICYFDKKKLSTNTDSFVINVSSTEKIKKRNNLHFTVDADIFIPAGGRPYTVNEKNMHKFKKKNNSPSCKGIVEGANIFFSNKARNYLQSLGIKIVKDSSANKTGVICSSYEIISSLILNKKELGLIKETYIYEVINILKKKAQLESKILFNELTDKNTLVEISKEISKVINEITDHLSSKFTPETNNILKDPLYQSIIFKYCPTILEKNYKQHILNNLPQAYQIAILSSYCASYIVYKEGLQWIYSFKKEHWHKAIITYMKNDSLSKEVIHSIKQSTLQNKAKIASVLEKSYAKESTAIDLALS